MQQAVLQLGTNHLHGIGQFEAALEGASCDAAVEIRNLLAILRRGLLHRLAGDDQAVLFHGDVEFALVEAGHRHGDAIGVFAAFLDIIRGIAGRGFIDAIGQFEQPVHMIETDAGAQQGGKIESTHRVILLQAMSRLRGPPTKRGRRRFPLSEPGRRKAGPHHWASGTRQR